jgi:hypothetical protein
VADILREHGKGFIERNRSWLNWLHIKVLLAIQRCRTAALGGHVDECVHCEDRATSYNSCRNRHCPKCQASAGDRWLAERSKELLPVPYVHVVFTLPHELAPLAYQNKRVVYGIRFFGFLARRKRSHLLPLCRSLLPATPSSASSVAKTGIELQQRRCRWGGLLKIVQRLTAVLHPIPAYDTS